MHCLGVERPTERTMEAILQPKYRSSIRDGSTGQTGRVGEGSVGRPFFTAAPLHAGSEERRVRRGSTAPPIMLNAIPSEESF